MFGTVRPCQKYLNNDNSLEYKKYYCGLCMGMERCAGHMSRMIINYDLCLAYLLADSINTQTNEKHGRCPFALWRKVTYIDSEKTLNYMAKINFLLTYHKLLDDVIDDNNLIARVLVSVMNKRYDSLVKMFPPHKDIIEKTMSNLHAIENANEFIKVKDAAHILGQMLETLMIDCLDDPLDGKIFSKLTYWIGVWIYVVDGCLDLKKDFRKRKYNPIFAGCSGELTVIIQERKQEVTDLLMECKNTIFQLLELFSCCKNKDLIYSIFEYDLPKEVADLLR